jgi:hypothetical protein
MVVFIEDLPLLSSHNPYRWYHLKVQTVLIPHAILGYLRTYSHDRPQGFVFTIRVGVHALSWFVTALVAFLTAGNGNVAEHRKWAI